MNNFLCTYTGKWSKIVFFGQKKGSPSEDVCSNAILHTTNIQSQYSTRRNFVEKETRGT